jgi:hypothetical protein
MLPANGNGKDPWTGHMEMLGPAIGYMVSGKRPIIEMTTAPQGQHSISHIMKSN